MARKHTPSGPCYARKENTLYHLLLKKNLKIQLPARIELFTGPRAHIDVGLFDRQVASINVHGGGRAGGGEGGGRRGPSLTRTSELLLLHDNNAK